MKRYSAGVAFIVLLAVSVVLFAPQRVQAAPIVQLKLTSEPGDFIGLGGSFDLLYTPLNSDFFFVNVTPQTGIPSAVHFVLGTVTGDSDNTFTTLDFSTAQLGIPLVPGFYPFAQRAPFAAPGHPGLDVSFQNRGCNTLSGTFGVHSAVFSPDGLALQQFEATFEQHCEEQIPALSGTIEFSEDGVTSVPEPSAILLIGTGLLPLVRRIAGRA